jgi:Zn-dependent metalloprotease
MCGPCCLIAPPDVLVRIAEEGAPEERDSALRTLATSVALRAQRATVGDAMRSLGVEVADVAFLAPSREAFVTVYDVRHGGDFDLPGDRIRGEGDSPAEDPEVNEAYEGAEKTYEFYRDVFSRDSIDGQGLEIVSSVHYGTRYDNAAWTGAQMIYGDGGGGMFVPAAMTKALDVIAHELTHGITDFTANLQYRKQSGALNESFSDVFGSLVKQRALGQAATDADWLIGEGILAPALEGVALRSLREPGTAHRFDSQPGSMENFVDLPDDDDPRNDHGGVHINSGIPNRAFQLAASAIGGNAWEKPGQIWYVTLTERLGPTSTFLEAAEATVQVAGELFGEDGDEQSAVRDAWETVGVLE